ncbi:MAG: hypothetical protein KAY50_06975 [Chitinophagaceae bacterium]|nr:hypothetical protein [Chitinophagaceae bacterium]
MIVSTDPDYLDTKLVKQGLKKLDPIFQELADWINQKFDTLVLNIYFNKIEVDKNRPRLSIIFEYYHDAIKFRDQIGNFDSNKQIMVAEKFKQILSKNTNTNNHLFARLFNKLKPSKFDTEKLLVIFDEFEPVAREEVNAKIPQTEIDRLKQEIASKNVWEIYREFATTTYFFYTDKQIEDYITDGTTQIMTQQYFDILKKYDEFDYIKPDTYFLTFDSKENFDKNFEGNWFWYSRR